MPRALILNWRDPWHPKAGGAEFMTLRLAQGLIKLGWDVEWFSALYRAAAPEEVRESIRFVRSGSPLTVHLNAYHRYRGAIDASIIIEVINTIPFFTPLYCKAVPRIALIYQLAREVWLYEAPKPLGWIGYVAEPFYLFPYRRERMATISPSSADSMRRIGFRGPISIVPIAVDERPDDVPQPKRAEHDIVMISRLAPSKRIEHAIHAAAMLRAKGWRGNLIIVGNGDAKYRRLLQAEARRTVPGGVLFEGYVSEQRKREALSAASVLWMTSVREGWGLVVTEAGRHWTPSVVYDVAGLRDAVIDRITGRIVECNPLALAEATHELFAVDYAQFSERAFRYSLEFTWERSVCAFHDALLAAIASHHQARAASAPAI